MKASTKAYTISRYPATTDRSLRAWSAADEYVLKHLADIEIPTAGVAIYHDRFGYLTTYLSEYRPIVKIHASSQHKSIRGNILANDLDDDLVQWDIAGEAAENSKNAIKLAVVKVPKSLDLLRLYLAEIASRADKDCIVICAFMTKHFTKQLLTIATEYFTTVEQSLAWKKSRMLLLWGPKKVEEKALIHTIPYVDASGVEHTLKQYYGVFSAKHVDYATQFLLSTLELYDSDERILDLASGNGIIAYMCRQQKPTAEIHLSDDSYLAMASAKLNLGTEQTAFHCSDTLDRLDDGYFDVVVCNPPFHFEHENTIDIALRMFADARRVLSSSGRFVCVANLHLNYKTHLEKLFGQVDTIAENEKFAVYQCWKG